MQSSDQTDPDASWFVPSVFKATFQTDRWKDAALPLLQELGPNACAAFVMFDRRIQLGGFPAPEVGSSPGEREAFLGFLPFADDGGLSHEFDVSKHVVAIEKDGTKVVMFGFLATNQSEAEHWIDSFDVRARQRMRDFPQLMSSMRKMIITASPAR